MKNFRNCMWLLVVASWLALPGCGRVAPTSPDTSPGMRQPDANLALVPPPSQGVFPLLGGVLRIVRLPMFLSTVTTLVRTGDVSFLNVANLSVAPNTETTVRGGAWQLDFHTGSLSAPKDVSILTAADGSLRVQFEPDGTAFGTPVDLTIDYSGTALDPASPSYRPGIVPQFLYFDPKLGAWVELPSTVDRTNRRVHAKLQHFSTYGLGGRAGW